MSIVQFVVDEAASLGRLQTINDMVQVGRGYGIRLVLIYQAHGQLKTCFPNGEDETLLANVTKTYFGVNDNATAEYVSTRMGESTIVVASGGTSTGGSYQYSYGAQSSSSRGSSSNTSSNWQQQARKLLKPEEVIALPPREAITFTTGVPPIRTRLLRYYEERGFGRRRGWLGRSLAAGVTLAASIVFCVTALLVSAALTQAVNEQAEQKYVIPSEMHGRPARIWR